jgi:hypothetical protein
MATTYNTIKLKKYGDIIEEYEAAAVITPGNLVELYSANKVRNHSTAGGNAKAMFALEDELQGKGIEDAYAAGDRVQVWVAQRGEIVYARLSDGESVTLGDFLESAGNGCLRKHTAYALAGSEEETIYSHPIVGQVLETQDLSDLSDGGGESSLVGNTQYVKVRIL